MRVKREGEKSEVAVFLPHNSCVALTMVGGSVTTNAEGGTFKHMIDGGGNTWTAPIN